MEFKTLKRFINEYEVQWSEATTTAYETDIRLFLENMISKKAINDEILLLQSITNDDYEDWKEETKGQYALASVNRKITSLKLFFKYIEVNKKIITYNPLDGIKIIKPSRKKISPWKLKEQKDILTHEELLKVIAHSYIEKPWERNFKLCSSRDRFLLSFEVTTGVRISEALDITFDMIEKVTDGYMVNINKTKTDQSKRVPIANKCLEYFEEYIAIRKTFNKSNNNYLIISHLGNKMSKNKCNDNIEKLLDKAEIKGKHITSHSNRHMFRTTMTANGIQENLIKIIGGWIPDTMAGTYIKDTKELDGVKIKACNLI